MLKESGVRKRYCQRKSTLTRFSERKDVRLRAEVKIVLEKKIEIDEIVP